MKLSVFRMATRAAMAIVSATAVVTVSAAPAWPAGRDQPLYGDLNGDGLIDRVTLAVAPPASCAVRVERGRPGGGYRATQTYLYPEPGGGAIGACPDLGVIVDLGGDRRVELVLAWFAGRPPGVDTDLLVLRDFTPAGGFTAVFQPSRIGTAEFNGDGRLDLYEWTDQGEGFRTYLNTPEGALVPGPVRWCFINSPGVAIADFHRNGRADVVIAYTEECAEWASGVVVVRDDGSPVQLERDPLAEHSWSVRVLDVNQDRHLDVRTENRVTGEVTHHLNRGDATFVESPSAVADRAYLTGNAPARIRVLANDAVTPEARVFLVQQPASGTARVDADQSIVYTPRAGHGTTDRLVYHVVQDGKKSTTSVSIRFSTAG